MANVFVILVNTSMSENIGTTARAAANMGVGSIRLVNPYRFEEDIIRAVATRTGEHLVDGMEVFDDLEAAIGDLHYVIGTTARKGNHRGPFFTPREIAHKMIGVTQDHKIGIMFGPERAGLETAELRYCQSVVRIPTADAKTSSLNLAQAVLILSYELFLAGGADLPKSNVKHAPMNEQIAMYKHLADTLVGIGFLPDDNTGHWLMNFKKIYNRSGLTHGECNLIRGMCRQINWAVKTGGKRPFSPELDGIIDEENNEAE